MSLIKTCSEQSSFGIIGPRISFSNDPKSTISVETPRTDTCQTTPFDSGSDFVFCISNVVAQKLSSADELFSNGKIVPVQINAVSKSLTRESTRQPPPITLKKRLKEFLSEAEDDEFHNEEPHPNSSSFSSSKFFRRFNRSCSVNCDGATRGKRTLRSSLQFMSRSYSTGSASKTPKQGVVLRENTERRRLQKQSSGSSFSSSASSNAYYFYDSSQKPSLKKNFGSSSGNGVRIRPVLNLPCRKATMSFFEFGSLFCNGKIKKKN